MKNVLATNPPRKPLPTATEAGTTAALLETIRTALEGDGSWIEPSSIDSQGLTVVAGIYRWRLELSEPEMLDWVEHSPPERPDRDLGWMSETDEPF